MGATFTFSSRIFLPISRVDFIERTLRFYRIFDDHLLRWSHHCLLVLVCPQFKAAGRIAWTENTFHKITVLWYPIWECMIKCRQHCVICNDMEDVRLGDEKHLWTKELHYWDIHQPAASVCLLINHIIVKRARKYPVLPTNILTELTEIFWEIWKTKLIRRIDRSWWFKRDTFLKNT